MCFPKIFSLRSQLSKVWVVCVSQEKKRVELKQQACKNTKSQKKIVEINSAPRNALGKEKKRPAFIDAQDEQDCFGQQHQIA